MIDSNKIQWLSNFFRPRHSLLVGFFISIQQCVVDQCLRITDRPDFSINIIRHKSLENTSKEIKSYQYSVTFEMNFTANRKKLKKPLYRQKALVSMGL